MKAVTTFDLSKKIEFATYATRCIDNEILMFVRKQKKYENIDSLEEALSFDKEGNELKIQDILSDNIDIDKEYINNETNRIMRAIINDLSERDRKIIILHFGFYNNKPHTQRELSKMLSISQSYVSRLIKKVVKKIGEELEIRRDYYISDNITRTKKEGETKMGRKLQTIYQFFKEYTKEEIDMMISKLSDEERKLMLLRYGNDLNNPVAGTLNKEEHYKFYHILIPKMKRLLSNPDNERKPRKKKVIELAGESNNVREESQNIISCEILKQNNVIPDKSSKNNNDILEVMEEPENEKLMTKEDYQKILELLKTNFFDKMAKNLTPKEALVAALKLGYIEGKCYSTLSISQFLDIEQQEVIDITRKVLLGYKDKINQIIDNTIDIVVNESFISDDRQKHMSL